MPISHAQVSLFLHYGGDPDGLARHGSAEEQGLMAGDTWGEIEQHRLDLANLKAGQLSPAARQRALTRAAAALEEPAFALLWRHA
jgi:hypothetical protein